MQSNHRAWSTAQSSTIRSALWTVLCLVAMSGFATDVTNGAEAKDLVEVHGRVVDPDGKPAPNAKVHLWWKERLGPEVACGPDGSFSTEFRKSSLNGRPWQAEGGWTMVNVVGNCLATVVISKWEGEFREASDAQLEAAAVRGEI